MMLREKTALEIVVSACYNKFLYFQEVRYCTIKQTGANSLPRAGYRTLTVTEELYQQLQKVAEEANRSIPEHIKHCIDKEQNCGN